MRHGLTPSGVPGTGSRMVRQYRYDVLVIGSGASGLGVALQVAEHAEVAVLSS